jgi:predicted CXXCH cytochrome family protein
MSWRIAFTLVGLSCASAGAYAIWGVMSWRPQRVWALPQKTTAAHAQIESRCELCHVPFGGVTNAVCMRCHEAGLTASNDSHPQSKFDDPRNAVRIEHFDATKCVTCHREHAPEITDANAVSVPRDVCYECHSDVADERPTHLGVSFMTCQSSGCHHFHDNRSLYEDYLREHLDEPQTKAPAPIARTLAVVNAPEAPERGGDAQIIAEWSESTHATNAVNCSGCHRFDNDVADKPGLDVCERCHAAEGKGWRSSRHGMRVEAGLEPMHPSQARMLMKAEAHARSLDCMSCHDDHRFDTQRAATDACLQCHDDSHSRAFIGSPHEQAGSSCATCHLPREHGAPNHNVSELMRPSDKMARRVCVQCHGLEYALTALADADTAALNFFRPPSQSLQTFDYVRRRIDEEKHR